MESSLENPCPISLKNCRGRHSTKQQILDTGAAPHTPTPTSRPACHHHSGRRCVNATQCTENLPNHSLLLLPVTDRHPRKHAPAHTLLTQPCAVTSEYLQMTSLSLGHHAEPGRQTDQHCTLSLTRGT